MSSTFRGGWNGKFSIGDNSNSNNDSIDIYNHESDELVGYIEIDSDGVISVYRRGEGEPIAQVKGLIK
jgi:hypothetical protein